MLEADGMELVYGHRTLLRDVYLRCDIGQVLGVTGKNGAGKSSLLKVLFGAVEPRNKSIRYREKYLHRPYSLRSFIRYVPREGYVFPYLKPSELMAMYGIEGPSLEALMRLAPLSENHDRKFGTLSQGLQKFLQIMVTLYSKAQYILLDDPFAGLSPLFVETLMEHVTYQKQDRGIIIASAQLALLERVSDDILVIKE